MGEQGREGALNSVAILLLAIALPLAAAEPSPDARDFAREVDRRLEVPAQEQEGYARRLESALGGVALDPRPQYFVLVDRSRLVQAALVFWGSPGDWRFIGASPASTGRPGGFEHFLTPLGGYPHSLANMDFRALGTRNDNGILGYGRKGMRVFDFGWIEGERTWGKRALGWMRLQMHATDPGLLEPQLGAWHSKGCIRIPATLNVFLDRHGLLDADYEAALEGGQRLGVLRADRQPTATPGRWLLIVESPRSRRPDWARPRAPGRKG